MGKHQLAFGARYRHERFGYLPDRGADTISFSNLATAEYDPTTGANYGAKPNTGYADADFFLGAADAYSQVKNSPFGHYRDQEIDTFIQDNFQVDSRFTINAGLRWEVHPAPYAGQDNWATFDLAHDALVLPRPLSYYEQNGLTTPAIVANLENLGAKFETPQQAGLPSSSGIYNSNFNFLPRLGFAYTPPFGKWGTVIRGGYGEYIYPVPVRNSIRYLTQTYPFNAAYSQSYVSASQSPDGLPNYLLRAPQTVIAGANSANVVNTASTNALLPGISQENLAAQYPPAHVRDANFTVEQPFPDSSVVRISYVFTHGYNLDQNYQYNNAPSTYTWEATTGTVPPTGKYSATATRPYDQTLWGNNTLSTKTGWSNDSALQVNYQRPFKSGFAYQIFYVYSRAFRLGGNTFRDNLLYPAANFAPGVLPAGLDTGTLLDPSHALNHYENYHVDTAIPEHHLTFNGIVDLPVGRGKRFLHNTNRWLDALVGGYQVAFVGQLLSQSFQVAAGNWGATSAIQAYGSAAPINDCRSGVCHPEDLWFNGYLSPTVINASKNGASGLPANYTPYLAPINNVPGISNFGTNNVTVTLKNGKQVVTGYSPGPVGANPFSQTVLLGPYNFNADISLYKVFALTERIQLRINVDAFNAFNIQGRVNPSTTDGTESFLTSYWTPRQIQLSARITF